MMRIVTVKPLRRSVGQSPLQATQTAALHHKAAHHARLHMSQRTVAANRGGVDRIGSSVCEGWGGDRWISGFETKVSKLFSCYAVLSGR